MQGLSVLIKAYDDDGVINGARRAELIDQYFVVIDDKSSKLIDIAGTTSSGSKWVKGKIVVRKILRKLKLSPLFVDENLYKNKSCRTNS